MLETPIYNEIRKIDSRPLTATPEPGSLGDLIKNSGLKPFTNYVQAVVLTGNISTYTTIVDITGNGFVQIQYRPHSNAYGYIRVTVDGVVVGDYFYTGSNTDTVLLLGQFKFNSSLKIEASNAQSANYQLNLYVSYYV